MTERKTIPTEYLILGCLALFPLDGDDGDELVRHAETAMQRAKAGGRAGYRFHQPQHDADLRQRMRLDHAVRQALASNRFRLKYQPQIDLRTGRRSGGPRDLEFFGHPLESLEHGRSVIHPDDWHRIHESLEETKRNGEPVSIEYRALRADGSARWLRMTGQCVFTSQGLPHGIVGTYLGWAARKRAARAPATTPRSTAAQPQPEAGRA